MSRDVGFIGVGKMGEAMVERLLEAGYSVDIWNRTPEKAASLVEKGARLVSSPAEAARHEVVFSMLLNDNSLDDMLDREDGVLASRPVVWVDCSSISPDAVTRGQTRAAESGTEFLSAPVSGNPTVVRAGNLIFAVSGSAQGIEVARPYLEAIGRAVHVVGDTNQAAVVKICTNALLHVVMQTLAEVLVLGEKSGVSRKDMLAFINDSAIGSPFTGYKAPALVSLDMAPTFTVEGVVKDLGLAVDLAATTGAHMPVVDVTREEFVDLVASGKFEGLDMAAALLHVASASGLNPTAE